MRCDDCLKPCETLYWVDRPGWLVCAACLPAHFRPVIGPWVMSGHAGFTLETKVPQCSVFSDSVFSKE